MKKTFEYKYVYDVVKNFLKKYNTLITIIKFYKYTLYKDELLILFYPMHFEKVDFFYVDFNLLIKKEISSKFNKLNIICNYINETTKIEIKYFELKKIIIGSQHNFENYYDTWKHIIQWEKDLKIIKKDLKKYKHIWGKDFLKWKLKNI